MKKKSLLFILLICIFADAANMSLKQCLQYALTNNSNLKMSVYDKKIAKKKIDMQISSMLPQISGSGNMAYDLQNGSAIEKTGNYGATASAELNQSIYDPAFSTGLKGARIAEQKTTLSIENVKEQTVYSVCCLYFQILIYQKQLDVYKRIVAATDTTLKAAEMKFANGAAKKIDVDNMKVSYNNSCSRVRQIKLNYEQKLNILKNEMGLTVDSQLVLIDTLDSISVNAESESLKEKYWEKRNDYKQLQNDLEIQKIEKKLAVAGYLPSLSYNMSGVYQSISDGFTMKDRWNTDVSFGLSLSIPVFDGFQKKTRIEQYNLSIEKAKENIAGTELSIKVDVSNYEIQLRIAIDNVKNEEANFTLAEDIYKNTRLSFQQGAASTVEMVQAESSMRETENNYFNTILSYYNAMFALELAKGDIMKYTKENR